MYKFYIASDKQIKASKPKNMLPGTVNVYMVHRGTVPLPFVDIMEAMENTFESLVINEHKFGHWFRIDIQELLVVFDIQYAERSFELKKEQFII